MNMFTRLFSEGENFPDTFFAERLAQGHTFLSTRRVGDSTIQFFVDFDVR